jgi:YidC/Oxa1 family membrane protein insertase
MWDLIINPFSTILTALYALLGNNIVLAIVVFTIAIRLATSPLLLQQQRSTRKMQELQPKLTKLKEKYKNDREKLAQEQMALYREAGINPLGGCLPLLVQLPILIAVYQAIIHALAGTPFQLIDLSGRLLLPGLDNLVPLDNTWIGMDLTLPPTTNPAYALALPLLVLVTTWLQSKLTIPAVPKSADGKPDPTASMTASMTTIMPLMFGFFSLSFSVGLSIYFVVSNIIGIVQYTLMGKAQWRSLLGMAPAPQPATQVVTGKATPVETEAASKSVASKNGASPRTTQPPGKKNNKARAK